MGNRAGASLIDSRKEYDDVDYLSNDDCVSHGEHWRAVNEDDVIC